jgi:protein-S-isoprenylcysteine O-methyltransferase Ste14
MKLVDSFNRVATGPRRRRRQLTPLGLTLFAGFLALVVGGGLLTDRLLGLPPLPAGRISIWAGASLLLGGAAVWGWCVVRFDRAGGTPVPFNPPDTLIETGLYRWVRNPMLTGVFLSLFGGGLLLRSVGIVALWTPAFILFNAVELKRVEEPELERRFGTAYADYRRRVPMFLPRPWRR